MYNYYTSISLFNEESNNFEFGLWNGDSQQIFKSLPKTLFKLSILLFFAHFVSSFFKVSIWVSSDKIADI